MDMAAQARAMSVRNLEKRRIRGHTQQIRLALCVFADSAMKKQIPSHIEMLWHIGLVLCTLLQLKVNAQNATCDTATEQPVVTRVNPPSGTTGEEAGVSSTYAIQGERLDSILGAVILNPPSLIPAMHTLALQRENSSTISFRIPRTINVRRMGDLVNLIIYPNNSACQNVSLQLTILDTGKLKHAFECMWVHWLTGFNTNTNLFYMQLFSFLLLHWRLHQEPQLPQVVGRVSPISVVTIAPHSTLK